MSLPRRPRHLLPSLLVAVLVAACSSSSPQTPPDDEATGQAAVEQEPDEPAGAAGSITLSGQQQSHGSGATVAVTGITVDEAGDVFVDLEALAAGRGSTYLAMWDTLLIDDLGNTYPFVAPEQNPTLNLSQDTMSELTLAFVGPIDPEATRVSLGLNADGDQLQTVDDTPPSTGYPTFAFEALPLPGVGLDDEAAGPEDPVGLEITHTEVDVDGFVHEGSSQVLVEVTKIEVAPSQVYVTVEARNNSTEERHLIDREPVLRAERDGQSYGNDAHFDYQWLTTDEGEFDVLALGPGDEVTARFAFRGSVPAEATGLRLGLQTLVIETDEGGTSVPENPYSGPTVVFTGLPLPEGFAGADAASEHGIGGGTPSDTQSDD